MPKAKWYTEKRFVMLTPAQARQLERLSQHQEVSVPELIRTALRQHYGLPTESDPTMPAPATASVSPASTASGAPSRNCSKRSRTSRRTTSTWSAWRNASTRRRPPASWCSTSSEQLPTSSGG